MCLLCEGHLSNRLGEKEIELTPSFAPDNHKYSALVPYGMQGVRLVIRSRGGLNSSSAGSSECMLNEPLECSESDGSSDMKETCVRVSLSGGHDEDCNLVVCQSGGRPLTKDLLHSPTVGKHTLPLVTGQSHSMKYFGSCTFDSKCSDFFLTLEVSAVEGCTSCAGL